MIRECGGFERASRVVATCDRAPSAGKCASAQTRRPQTGDAIACWLAFLENPGAFVATTFERDHGGGDGPRAARAHLALTKAPPYSTVTLFAKLRGWSASFPMKTAV